MKISKNEYKHYERYSDKCKFKSPEEELEYSKITTKKCNKCGCDLPLINFGLNTAGSSPFDKDGYRYRRGDCVDCNKKQNEGKNAAKKLAKSLGIDTKAPEGTKCEICGKTEKIVFDHDHEKNEFRGWLCDGCNRSIGMLSISAGGSDFDGLIKSLKYIIRSESDTDKKSDMSLKLFELIELIELNEKKDEN
jgi:hypothetical protein